MPKTHDLIDSWRLHGDYNQYLEIPVHNENRRFFFATTSTKLTDYSYSYYAVQERAQLYFDNFRTSTGNSFDGVMATTNDRQMILTFTGLIDNRTDSIYSFVYYANYDQSMVSLRLQDRSTVYQTNYYL